MRIFDFGKENKDVIILLHGGGLSWWNFREEAEILKNKYHVILPILNGHADSNQSFTSIEDNARDLIAYIDAKFDGKVLAIGGLSLGAQILLEMLAQRSNICRYAIVESALAIPMKTVCALTDIAVNMSYPLISKLWFAELQFKSLNIKHELFDEYYQDSCKIAKQDMIAFLKSNTNYHLKDNLSHTKTKVLILVGTKEQKIMRDSARLIHQMIPASELEFLSGYTHGEISINHASKYVEKLEKLFSH